MTDNNYQAPESELSTPETESREYAGFWIRFGASLLDNIFLSIAIIPLFILVIGFEGFVQGGGGFLGIFLSYILPAILVIGFWIVMGATPGKMVCKVRLIDEKTGEKPSAGKSILRYIGYFISMIPLFLGFIWVAFDKKKQAWHDKISGIVVVKN